MYDNPSACYGRIFTRAGDAGERPQRPDLIRIMTRDDAAAARPPRVCWKGRRCVLISCCSRKERQPSPPRVRRDEERTRRAHGGNGNASGRAHLSSAERGGIKRQVRSSRQPGVRCNAQKHQQGVRQLADDEFRS